MKKLVIASFLLFFNACANNVKYENRHISQINQNQPAQLRNLFTGNRFPKGIMMGVLFCGIEKELIEYDLPKLDKYSHKLMIENAYKVFNYGLINEEYKWDNGGYINGSLMITGQYNSNNHICKSFKQKVIIGNNIYISYGNGCKKYLNDSGLVWNIKYDGKTYIEKLKIKYGHTSVKKNKDLRDEF